ARVVERHTGGAAPEPAHPRVVVALRFREDADGGAAGEPAAAFRETGLELVRRAPVVTGVAAVLPALERDHAAEPHERAVERRLRERRLGGEGEAAAEVVLDDER